MLNRQDHFLSGDYGLANEITHFFSTLSKFGGFLLVFAIIFDRSRKKTLREIYGN